MDGGKIVAEGSPRELIERYSTREVVELRFHGESQEAFADKLAGVGERLEVLPDRILLYVANGDEAVGEVGRRALAPASVLVRRSGLEDVFLHLTGRTLVD
jgi:lipooligosaccharide transport system ATP-binding protein